MGQVGHLLNDLVRTAPGVEIIEARSVQF
jgi:hypothetical protein